MGQLGRCGSEVGIRIWLLASVTFCSATPAIDIRLDHVRLQGSQAGTQGVDLAERLIDDVDQIGPVTPFSDLDQALSGSEPNWYSLPAEPPRVAVFVELIPRRSGRRSRRSDRSGRATRPRDRDLRIDTGRIVGGGECDEASKQ